MLRRLWLLCLARVVGLPRRWSRRATKDRLGVRTTSTSRGAWMRALIRPRCVRAAAERRRSTKTTGRAGVTGATTWLTKAGAGSAKSGVSPGVSWWCT